VKPNTGNPVQPITAPYDRDDEFAGPKLGTVWQWNHVPDDSKWSLKERPGYLRLHSLPAKDFWWARNSLTQRAMGPESTATAELDPTGLKDGDVAGLALLNLPFSWVGVVRDAGKMTVEAYDQTTGKSVTDPFTGTRVWLRTHCNFDVDVCSLSYSTDGVKYKPMGPEMNMPFQLTTFQGIRYALFNYNKAGNPGGQADFNYFRMNEPRPRGLTKPIPVGKTITFSDIASGNPLAVAGDKVQLAPAGENGAAFRIVDRGRGRISLQTKDGRYVSVAGEGKTGDVILKKAAKPGDAETFQWVDLQRGDTLLMSLVNHRYIVAPKTPGDVAADRPGPAPDRKDGSCFTWKVVGGK
jgi:hypothetical protein